MSFIKYFLPYGFIKLIGKIKLYKTNKHEKNRYKSILKRNICIKNRYTQERCFILGNGSSLKYMNLRLLKNEYTYVVNDFILHNDLYNIAPTFYSTIEPISILNNYQKKSHYYIDNFYSRIDKALKPLNIILFFRAEFQEYIEKNMLFKNKEIHYLHGLGSLNNEDLFDDICEPNSFMDGVIYSAICNCAYMGFKSIYFIGCDCDWFRKKTEAHFYENYAETSTLENSTNEELLLANYKTLRNWRIVITHFRNKGIKIYNAGIGGDNDTCERVDYSQIFNSLNK